MSSGAAVSPVGTVNGTRMKRGNVITAPILCLCEFLCEQSVHTGKNSHTNHRCEHQFKSLELEKTMLKQKKN